MEINDIYRLKEEFTSSIFSEEIFTATFSDILPESNDISLFTSENLDLQVYKRARKDILRADVYSFSNLNIKIATIELNLKRFSNRQLVFKVQFGKLNLKGSHSV